MQRTFFTYPAARPAIQDGDLLLYRPRDWFGRIIADAGDSKYCHAAMAGWWGDKLMNVEMTRTGGRAQKLSNIVHQYPNVIDVYHFTAKTLAEGESVKHCEEVIRNAALSNMIDITAIPYGWKYIYRAIERRLFGFPLRGEVPGDMPDCSVAFDRSYEAAGAKLLPGLDHDVEPADLAKSVYFAYSMTLEDSNVPTE